MAEVPDSDWTGEEPLDAEALDAGSVAVPEPNLGEGGVAGLVDCCFGVTAVRPAPSGVVTIGGEAEDFGLGPAEPEWVDLGGTPEHWSGLDQPTGPTVLDVARVGRAPRGESQRRRLEDLVGRMEDGAGSGRLGE